VTKLIEVSLDMQFNTCCTVKVGIAVVDRMLLEMQDFDFCPNLIKFYSSFTEFYLIYPNLPKFAQILPNLPKKFARGQLLHR